MKSRLFATLALVVFSNANAADVLTFQFNKDVVVKISNVACPLKKYKDKYPYGAVAERSDGQYLFGCFRKKNEDEIEIQWAAGDTSVFPANAFLMHQSDSQPKPETRPVEPTL